MQFRLDGLINLLQAMQCILDFESDIENLKGNYQVIERRLLQIQDILLQCLKFN